MRKWIALIIALTILLSLTACEKENTNDLMVSVQPNKTEKITDFTKCNRELTNCGLNLFRESYAPDKNTLISPLSVLYALSMTANGAKGDTLAQMEAVFGLDVETLNLWLSSYSDELSGELKLANSIWFRDSQRFTVNEDFLQTNADYYGAGIFKTPFDEGTCKEINAWVEEHTDGMIQDILNEIPDGAVMYLVNALAFDAQWQEIYSESDIRDGEFTTQWGYSREVEMMYSEESLYLSDEYAQGFIKPYEGGRYAFAALLPNPGVTVEEYLESLTGEHLQEMLSAPNETKVKTALPKFEAEYDVEMSDILKAMGMTDAFDGGKADLSGIGHSDNGNLFINRVLHKTYICVDGKGTKAGAATAVEVNDECAIVEPDFYMVYLDRPFLYMLIDLETNLPFFMGAMMDPTGEEAMPIAEEPLSGPPELNVLWNDGAMVANTGNYAWEGPAVNGQTQAVIACGAHPLDNIGNRDFTAVTGEWLTLSFPVWPDEITVHRWPATEIGNTDHWGEVMTLEGNYLRVEHGDWVYQIIAKWNGDDWGGSAEYHLYISRQE